MYLSQKSICILGVLRASRSFSDKTKLTASFIAYSPPTFIFLLTYTRCEYEVIRERLARLKHDKLCNNIVSHASAAGSRRENISLRLLSS